MADTDTKTDETKQNPDAQVNADKATEKMLPQSEVDKIVEARLARDRKKWEAEYQSRLEDERKKAAMTETEKLKAEKEAAEKKATQALAAANEVLVRAEVKSIAADMGLVDGDAAYALLLANGRDDVEVKDGRVTGVKEVLEALVKEKPWLKKTDAKGGSVGAGTNPGGAPNSKTDMNAFIRKAAGRG